jgi:hypothetical protein
VRLAHGVGEAFVASKERYRPIMSHLGVANAEDSGGPCAGWKCERAYVLRWSSLGPLLYHGGDMY